MESAEGLVYEVRVYARVPDLGDGADRRGGSSSSVNANAKYEGIIMVGVMERVVLVVLRLVGKEVGGGSMGARKGM
jgi:hypothetical protein